MNPNNASHPARSPMAANAAAQGGRLREPVNDVAGASRSTAFPTETLLNQMDSDISALTTALTDTLQGMAAKVAALRDRYFELQHQVQHAAHDRAGQAVSAAADLGGHAQMHTPAQDASFDQAEGAEGHGQDSDLSAGEAEEHDGVLEQDLDAHFDQATTALPLAAPLRAAPSGMRRPGAIRQDVSEAVYTQPDAGQQRAAAQQASAPLSQAHGQAGATGGVRRQVQAAPSRPAAVARTSAPPHGLDPMGGAPSRGMRRVGSAG